MWTSLLNSTMKNQIYQIQLSENYPFSQLLLDRKYYPSAKQQQVSDRRNVRPTYQGKIFRLFIVNLTVTLVGYDRNLVVANLAVFFGNFVVVIAKLKNHVNCEQYTSITHFSRKKS
eukprot:TRINITY_DN2121_c0_g1_i7.p2 TRINITY_DN2121_c0_g1~~TRINITY_DN2121_c0_g1_i7.p2  ORF type:complete len:116 (-),score=2.56 TRINITY_DN2121_c0_g1_i7:2-349(-)